MNLGNEVAIPEMSAEELQARYNQLAEEELAIPVQIGEILKSIESLKQKATDLEKQAFEIDLQVSEKPVQVFEKQCGSAFIGFGKTCVEVPMANPEMAREVVQRNDIVREKNAVIDEINPYFKKVADFTERQVDIEAEQVAIRGQLIDVNKKILLEPSNILGFLGRKIKSLFYKEEFEEAVPNEVEAPPIKKYLPYVAIGGSIILILVLMRKGKKEVKK